MRLRISIVLVVWTAGWAQSGPTAASDEQVAAWFRAAQQAKAGGELALAVSEYRKVIQARPELAEGHSNLGVVYYLQGRCADALTAFRKALDLKPGLFYPLLYSAICHTKADQYARAVALLQQALAARTAESQVYFYLGVSYSGLKQEERANECFRKAVELEPKDVEALYQLGESCLRLSSANFERARRDGFFHLRAAAELAEWQGKPVGGIRELYDKAIRLRPTYPNTNWNLGRLLLAKHDSEGAQAALSRELRLNPNHLPALLLKAGLHRRAGEDELEAEALARAQRIFGQAPRTDADFARLVESHPATAASFLNVLLEFGQLPKDAVPQTTGWPSIRVLEKTLAGFWNSLQERPPEDWLLEVYIRARLEQGKLIVARNQLRELTRRYPNWTMPYFLLGETYRRLSLAAYARMVELEPGGYRTLLLKAETHESRHDDEEAERAYRSALSRRPDVAGLHYRLGGLLARKRQFEAATAELLKALAMDPHHTAAKVRLGEIYLEQNELDKAVPLLLKSIEEDPGIASAYASLGKALLKQGKPAEAARMLERSVKLDPDNVSTRYRLATTYQELGRPQDAEAEFAAFRKLSEKTAQGSPGP